MLRRRVIGLMHKAAGAKEFGASASLWQACRKYTRL